MPRRARIVHPGLPHHVTQRGNRRQPVFFRESDYALYLDLLAAECRRAGVRIWCWCLMPNHVHLIAVPASDTALAAAMGAAHRRYSTLVNRREGWTGYLWQGRFDSAVMDEAHLLSAARYIALNPVAAGLAARPELYRWSSAAAHLAGAPDRLADTAALAAYVQDWPGFWAQAGNDPGFGSLMATIDAGRPAVLRKRGRPRMVKQD